MILGIAGRIASGKSTLARNLATKLGFRRIGFGDYVRSIARANGLDPFDRTVLQELGQRLVGDDPSAFASSFLASADYRPPENVVLDGVRHEAVWNEIKALALSRSTMVRLVYLDAPDAARRIRITAREGDWDTTQMFDRHPSEADLELRVAALADLVLDGRLSETQLVDAIAAMLKAS